MAIKQTIQVEVQSNLAQEAKEALLIKERLEAAGKVRLSTAVLAAQQGVTNTKKMAAPQPAGGISAGSTASDTNLSRGIGGLTGASSRDFAAQAQGLGGLVHVYATFAANLFAVSAAFGALSKAADTTNMVKGLDQLGAASGKALGSLSKQMVAVADGALSMRDAISSTALASAGGMTNANILKMTEIAKKASLALGRDMTDSMDRLTKGIVKIQPELLDELGIMARVIPSQEAYARQLGKTVGSLTDFEKRQAFANAVLEEGNKKFSAINIDANPYSKISASIINLTQSGLELINKVLGPVLSILSESPTALAVAMGTIGVVLLKQAIPAIGMFRQNAKIMAEEAHARVRSIVALQIESAGISDEIAARSAEKRFQSEKSTMDKVESMQKARFNKQIVGKDVRGLLVRSPFDLSDKEIASIRSKSEDLLANDAATYKKQGAKLKAHLTEIDNIKASSLQAGLDAAQKQEDSDNKWYSHQEQLARKLRNLNRAAGKRDVLSTVADTAVVQGPLAAFKALGEGTSKLDMGKLGKSFTYVQGTLSILTSSVSTAISAFGMYAQIAGVVIAALGMLSNYFTKNAHEAEAFTKALETSIDAIRLATDVYNNFINLPEGTALSVSTILAKSNAVVTLTQSISDQVTKYKDVLENAGAWDKFTEDFWGFFGRGAGDKLANSINDQLVSALKLLDTGDARDQAIKSLSKSLNLGDSNTNLDLVTQKIKQLGNSGEAGVPKLQVFSNAVKDLAKGSENSVAKLSGLNTSLENLGKASADFNNSLLPKTDQDKFALSLIDSALSFGDALKLGPVEQVAALNNLLKDSKNLALFGKDDIANLLKYKAQLDTIGQSQKKAIQAVDIARKSLDTAKNTPDTTSAYDPMTGAQIVDDSSSTRAALMERATSNLSKAEDTLRKVNESAKVTVEKVAQNLVANGFTKGIALLDAGLISAATKASVIIGQAKLAGLSGPGVAEEANRLRQLSIKSEMSLVEATYANTLATIQNSVAYEKSTAEEKLAKLPVTPANKEEIDRVKSTIAQLNMAGDIITKVIDKQMNSKALSAILKEATKAGDLDKVRALIPLKSASQGRAVALTGLTAQSTASNIQAEKDSESEILARKQKLNSMEQTSNTLSKEKLALQQSYSDLYNEDLIVGMQQKDTDNLRLAQDSQMLAVQKEMLDLLDSGFNSESEAYKAKLKEKLQLVEIQKLEEDILKIKQVTESKSKGYALNTLEIKQKNELLDIQGKINSSSLASEQARLNAIDSIGAIDKEFVATQTERLAQQQLEITIASSLRKLKEEERDALKPIYEQQAANRAAEIEDTIALTTEYNRIKELFKQRKLEQDSSNLSASEGLIIAKETAIEQAKLNKVLEEQKTLTENLTSIFGNLGTSIGDMVAAMDASARSQENLTKARQAELAALSEEDQNDPKKIADIKDKYQKRSTMLELKGIGEAAGAYKKSLNEKSVGFKILSGIEKASHMASLAMQAKEFLIKMGFLKAEVVGTVAGESTMTAASIAGSAMKAIGSIPAVLMKFMETLGPWGMAAGAAAIAMALSGGSSTSGVQGPSSEQRQEVQGSAMGYNDQGKLVQKSSGVFGDTTAQSESIANSLEIIKNNSIVGLDYDNKMLRALESLAKALDTTSRSLYKIPGLVSGSVTGLQEGVNTSGGFLGIGGLFSSTVTKNIVDSGLKLAGTFASLAKGAAGNIKLYEDIKTVVEDSGFFGLGASTSTTYKTKLTGLETLNPEAQKAITEAFSYGQDLIYGIGKLADVSENVITSKLSTLQINELVSLRGLKGEEFNKALSSVLSSIFDQAAEAVFTSFKVFAKFGEGMLETVVRVVDANNKLDQALRSIGSSFSILGKFDISETMISLAGSLTDFMDQAAYFRDNFLSEQEKLVPIQASVNKELTRLGISTAITKDQYKSLVLAQDLSTEAGQSMYQNLMDLAPGFIAMTSALETVSNTVAKTSKRLDLEKQIYEALGNSEKVLAMTRQAEIDSLKELDASLVPMQLYLNALQDEATLKGKLTTAYTNESNAIKSTITSLKNASKTITDYRTNLLKSTASILTPAEKYAQAKISLLQTAALATSVITANSTAEDIAARDAAIGQISSTADAFLASSKEMFASSDQYTKDFSTVLDVLDQSATTLDTQKTNAELQLTALDSSVSALNLITTNTDTTATLLAQLLSLQTATEAARVGAVAAGSTAATTAIPQFANGGYASGVSIVGERGPEVVDFKTPGRVYSNRASNDLFNTKELCEEIKSLRDEVAQLRKDQHNQTGHIIAANYDANGKNADQVSEATMDAVNQQQWQQRNQVKIA